MSLLERIKVLRETNGNISINKLEKEAGLTRGSMSKWDAHAPSYDKIKKVADYFNVPVSYLTGEEQQKKPVPEGELSVETIKLLLDKMSAADLAQLMADCAEEMRKRGSR